MDKTQKIQDIKYNFPYHYIPSNHNNNFRQVYNVKWGYEYISYLEFILKSLKELNFNTLIDIGCGDGRFLHKATREYPDKDFTGIDYSERAITLARFINPEIKFIRGDIADNIVKEKFDVATLIETLEHIPPKNIKDFINAISEALNSNGYLIVSVPSDNERVDEHHYQHFNIGKLKELLSPIFNISETYYLNKSGKGAAKIAKIFTNNLFILNHQGLRNKIYKYYKKYYLVANQDNARRICILCQKR
jgi:2-polyprenyl-3-methyl-5-hydroxy-6-metoxy-1,4-benzoquinol methylase